MKKIELGLVFGGASSEYEISLLSSTSVLTHINREKYHLHLIGITKEGKMYSYTGPVEKIADNTWMEQDCVPCLISPDRSHHGMLILNENKLETLRLDCVFPVLHGKNGEDGTIQGLLELAGIPFVGCGHLSSGACMDKIVTHTLLDAAGVPGARWRGTTAYDYQKNPLEFEEEVEHALGFPCFVKPANAGSSVGITKVPNRSALPSAIAKALETDSRIIVEEMVSGIEIECAVMGNEEPVASTLGEICPQADFYDYNAKYIDGTTKTYAPARISEKSTKEIKKIAVEAYRIMNCRGLARVDFFLTPDEEPILNEINTIPGFTKISMYPQLFAIDGISYPSLIDRLIEFAIAEKKENI